jgi:arylsulfatase A-like enzyme
MAITWWPAKIKAGTVNTDRWSHMDWWPTFARLAGLQPPPRQWKDNNGNPIIFDGIDLSESLLGTGPRKAGHLRLFQRPELWRHSRQELQGALHRQGNLARAGADAENPRAL